MHAEAMEYIERFATTDAVRVLDIGGRDINGSPRHLFPNAASYVVVDLHDGPGVDVVGDVLEWTPPHPFDVVVCAEVFEHTPDWPEILERSFGLLAPGGRLVVTCAGPGRGVHSAIDGEWRLHPGEHYANVDSDDLAAGMLSAGFVDVKVETLGADTRGTGVR